ncbi:MAG: bifunctional DNA primase/polymerase [Pseudonocardiaceae bacterium]
MAFAGHGWPVLRGTYLASTDTGQAQWRGRTGAVGLRPVDDDWPAGWTIRSAQVAKWWAAQPYSVLIATGRGVDCVELPELFRLRVLDSLAAAAIRPPAMLTTAGTLVLFVCTPTGPVPAVARRLVFGQSTIGCRSHPPSRTVARHPANAVSAG